MPKLPDGVAAFLAEPSDSVTENPTNRKDSVMSAILLCLLLVASSELRGQPRDRVVYVSCIERNQVCDDAGNDRISQYIFWNIDPASSRYVVEAWILTRDAEFRREGSVVEIYFHEDGVRHAVRSHAFKDTRTAFDPEVENRKFFPIECRRGLFEPKGSPLPEMSVLER